MSLCLYRDLCPHLAPHTLSRILCNPPSGVCLTWVGNDWITSFQINEDHEAMVSLFQFYAIIHCFTGIFTHKKTAFDSKPISHALLISLLSNDITVNPEPY